MTGESSSGEELLRRLNTAVAHPARIYDVWLGGKDNYPADRAAAAAGLQAFPSTISSVRANRAFLARTVEYLAGEEGIRQFLDIGTGLPSANNTHEVAQKTAAESHVVYVDNDPVVMLHAQALLTSSAPGVTDYIEADLRDPGTILAEAARTLDFTRPIAVMLLAIVQFISDDDHPYEIVNSLMDAVPPGSFLVVSHVASDIFPEELAAFARAYNERSSEKITPRNREDVARFFSGLDLVEPGVVQVSKWRPRSELEASATDTLWGGVARKTA
jgi:S-adenosyl methyltransferase